MLLIARNLIARNLFFGGALGDAVEGIGDGEKGVWGRRGADAVGQMRCFDKKTSGVSQDLAESGKFGAKMNNNQRSFQRRGAKNFLGSG